MERALWRCGGSKPVRQGIKSSIITAMAIAVTKNWCDDSGIITDDVLSVTTKWRDRNVTDRPWIDDYLVDGRRFKDRDIQALTHMWCDAVRRANSQNNLEAVSALREMNDLEAEFNLRGLEAPGVRKH
jgi:hypothetical protein